MSSKKLRGVLDPSSGGRNIGGLIDPGGTVVERLTGSSAARQLADPARVVPEDPIPAKEAAAKQKAIIQEDIRKQKQLETARLLEEESEVSRRRLTPGQRKAGRSLLIATSDTGRATTLGG